MTGQLEARRFWLCVVLLVISGGIRRLRVKKKLNTLVKKLIVESRRLKYIVKNWIGLASCFNRFFSSHFRVLVFRGSPFLIVGLSRNAPNKPLNSNLA